jgi:hypothetical protein
MKLIVLAAFLAVFGVVYYQYKKDKDIKEALLTLFFIAVVTGFSLFGRYTLVYKPLFVLHVLLVLFSWIEIFRSVFTKKRNLWIIFSPVFSVGLFFLIGYLFSK